MAELKPCPFCGLAGHLEAQFAREWWVQCESGHSTGIIHPSPAEAEEEWNRRVPVGVRVDAPTDTDRLEWLTRHISGKALREAGVTWPAWSLENAREAIDAARNAGVAVSSAVEGEMHGLAGQIPEGAEDGQGAEAAAGRGLAQALRSSAGPTFGAGGGCHPDGERDGGLVQSPGDLGGSHPVQDAVSRALRVRSTAAVAPDEAPAAGVAAAPAPALTKRTVEALRVIADEYERLPHAQQRFCIERLLTFVREDFAHGVPGTREQTVSPSGTDGDAS